MTTATLLLPMLQRMAELGERVNIEYALERQTIAIAAQGKPRRSQRGNVGWDDCTFAQTALTAQVAGQLTLIFAVRITSAHFGTSARSSCANSAGEFPTISAPSSANRFLTSSMRKAFFIA